jgi:hypothetical protein
LCTSKKLWTTLRVSGLNPNVSEGPKLLKTCLTLRTSRACLHSPVYLPPQPAHSTSICVPLISRTHWVTSPPTGRLAAAAADVASSSRGSRACNLASTRAPITARSTPGGARFTGGPHLGGATRAHRGQPFSAQPECLPTARGVFLPSKDFADGHFFYFFEELTQCTFRSFPDARSVQMRHDLARWIFLVIYSRSRRSAAA